MLDNTIDPATGMLVARAEFPNKDEALWPGQLCDVKVRLRVDDKASLGTSQAMTVLVSLFMIGMRLERVLLT